MAQSGLLRGDPGGETLMPSGFGNWMIVAGVVLILAGLASQFGLLGVCAAEVHQSHEFRDRAVNHLVLF
jgi:hypothetical protein